MSFIINLINRLAALVDKSCYFNGLAIYREYLIRIIKNTYIIIFGEITMVILLTFIGGIVFGGNDSIKPMIQGLSVCIGIFNGTFFQSSHCCFKSLQLLGLL